MSVTELPRLTGTPKMGIFWVETEVLTGALSGLTVGEATYRDQRKVEIDGYGMKVGDEYRNLAGNLVRVSRIVQVSTVEIGDLTKALREVKNTWKVGA